MQIDLFTPELKNPTSQITEVLYYLIKKDKINYRQIFFDTGILNLSARLSDLKLDYDLPIECIKIDSKNKFGRKINYGSWKLLDKQKGIEIYNKLA